MPWIPTIWNGMGVPTFDYFEEGRKWRLDRQAWRDKHAIPNPYGEPDLDDNNFIEFVKKHKTPKSDMPKAARLITPDRAQHLALTFNGWMYRSTIQKRAQLEEVIYWGYVDAVKNLLQQCMIKEKVEMYRYCRPYYKAYLDALAPVINIRILWEEEDVREYRKKRLELYHKWNKQKQGMWDKYGFNAIEEDNEALATS